MDSNTSNAPTTPTSAACSSPICFCRVEMPVEIVSETKSRNPKARMNPRERKRVRIHPRKPDEASVSLCQICSNNVFRAESTVVAPINNVTTLTRVDTNPSVFCELWIAPNNTFAVEGPNNAFSCAPIWAYAAFAPMTHPASVNMITSSGAREKAQKKANEAPVVEALSAIQLHAAHLVSAVAFLTVTMHSCVVKSGAKRQRPSAHLLVGETAAIGLQVRRASGLSSKREGFYFLMVLHNSRFARPGALSILNV